MQLFEAADSGIRLQVRVMWQPGGEEYRTPVDAQVWHRCGEQVVTACRFVEVRERGGQVARAKGNQSSVVRRVRGLKLLAGCREQAVSAAKVSIGPLRASEREIDQRTRGKGAPCPERVALAAEDGDSPVQVVERFAVPPAHPQCACPPHENLARLPAARLGRRGVKACQPRLCAPGVDEGDSERG